MTPEQKEDFEKLWELDEGELKYDSTINLITTLLEKQREEYVEMIENIPKELNGTPEQILYGIDAINLYKDKVINAMKSHDKTS